LRQARQLLRLREFGGVATVTWKGAPAEGPHKSREEIETTVADAAALHRLWERLGYRAVFRYEKYRTTFRRGDEAGEAVLDETPIGCFIELEGPAGWIDKNAQALGFGADEYNTESYAALYFSHCERTGQPAHHMVFGAGGSSAQ
jgi:adenylate cyclase, class 2